MRAAVPLEDRIAELEEEVRQLRAMLKPQIDFAPQIGLTERQAEVLAVLYARRNQVVSRNKLEMLVWPHREISDHLPHVIVMQMRDKLRRHGVEIVTIYGRGWVLTEAARARLDALRELQ